MVDSAQSMPGSYKNNEWLAGLEIWYNAELETPETGPVISHAYKTLLPADLPASDTDLLFGDIGFWGTTYNLKRLTIYKGISEMYIYLEIAKATDFSFLLEIIARVLHSDTVLTEITDVFIPHT